jgi:hypothetical protein
MSWRHLQNTEGADGFSMSEEEMIKLMDKTEDKFAYQFNDHEYLRVVKYLSKDRDSLKETLNRFMWSLTDKCKPS